MWAGPFVVPCYGGRNTLQEVAEFMTVLPNVVSLKVLRDICVGKAE